MAFGFLLVVGFACAGEEGDDTVPTAAPVGIVQGEVRDGATWEPLEGASLTLRAGADVLEATSDDDGRFLIEDVPAGSLLALDVAADGYATARTWVAVDDAAGEHPQGNSIAQAMPVLWPDDGEIAIEVRDAWEDEAVEDVAIIARPLPDDSGMQILGALEARTDEDGRATLEDAATWQTYLVIVQVDGYALGQTYLTQGQTDETTIWIQPDDEGGEGESEGECDGSYDYCCSWDDPCGLEGKGYCECPDCGWNAYDCY
ncbi:MAG: carboxypeptidase-like regulatory domain-containing protein [Myxococcota bacterium]